MVKHQLWLGPGIFRILIGKAYIAELDFTLHLGHGPSSKVNLNGLVEQGKDILRRCQAFLDSGIHFRELAYGFGQQSAGSNKGDDVTRAHICQQHRIQHQPDQACQGDGNHQLHRWCGNGLGDHHFHGLPAIIVADALKPLPLIVSTAKNTHHVIALHRLGGNVGHISHGVLETLTDTPKAATGITRQHTNEGGNSDKYQGQAPVQVKQVTQVTEHSKAFTDNHAHGVRCGARHLGHMKRHLRHQVAHAVLVIKPAWQLQQLLKQLTPQGVHQAGANVGNKIVPHKGTNTTAEDNHHNRQGNDGAIHCTFGAEPILNMIGHTGIQQRVTTLQGVNDVADELGKTDVRQGVDDKADNAEQKSAPQGPHIG